MYHKGAGVSQDFEKAKHWYTKSAAQGLAEAQYRLGVMYEYGDGVTQDDVEAVSWYRKAAEQGHARAQKWLGWMYSKGRGVPRDYIHAYKWYDIAIANGKNAYRVYRDRIEQKMTSTQIAKAQRLAREWHATH